MDPGRRIPNSARRTLRFVPAIALVDPDGFARERRAEPAATRHGGPFVRRVDEEVDGDGKRCGVPSEAPLRDSDGRSINDRDDVEVAAYAPSMWRVASSWCLVVCSVLGRRLSW